MTILQRVRISNHHIVYLELIQCDLSVHLHKAGKATKKPFTNCRTMEYTLDLNPEFLDSSGFFFTLNGLKMKLIYEYILIIKSFKIQISI